MAKEKVISEIIQTTKRGFDVHRVNYENHSEFISTFKFHTDDTLEIKIIPDENYSTINFTWVDKLKKERLIDQVVQHLDPMSILNRVGIIQHHVKDDVSEPLNGLMIIYKSLENEFDDHFDRLITVNEIPVGDTNILIYDRFSGIPQNIFSCITIDSLIKSDCEEQKKTILKEALNKIYGAGCSAVNATNA